MTCLTHVFSGKLFPIDAPTAEDIVPEDIFHALGNLCRFGGHTRYFYTVADHSRVVYRLAMALGASRAALAQALLHDAAEAYLVDLPRPIKALMPAYAEVEERILRAIMLRFGLPLEIDPIVWQADNLALAIEGYTLMPRSPEGLWPLPSCDLPQVQVQIDFFIDRLRMGGYPMDPPYAGNRLRESLLPFMTTPGWVYSEVDTREK